MSSLRVQHSEEASRDADAFDVALSKVQLAARHRPTPQSDDLVGSVDEALRDGAPTHAAAIFDAVVEQLMAVAARLETATREHDKLAPLEELARVRKGAADSHGELRALYEVAEAFLHAFDRGDFGALGVQLARFVRDHESAARDVLRAASSIHGQKVADLPPGVTNRVRELVAAGALREHDGLIRVRPSVRSAVAELVEPASVRMWRLVERARRSVLTAPAGRREELLGRKLGVDATLAREILGDANAIRSRLARRRTAPVRVLVRELYEVALVESPTADKPEEQLPGLVDPIEGLERQSPSASQPQELRCSNQSPTGSQPQRRLRSDQSPATLHSALP